MRDGRSTGRRDGPKRLRVARRLAAALCALMFVAPVAAVPPKPVLWVVNQREHTVLAVDAASGDVRARILTGVNGHEIALSKDGRLAYVPIYGDSVLGKPGSNGDSIDVIDTQTMQRVRTLTLGRAVRPHAIAVGRDGNLYVTAELAQAVLVINPADGQVVAEIPTGRPQSHVLALSPNGRNAYTSNAESGTISFLDMRKRTLELVVPAATHIQRVAVSADGRLVFTQDTTQPHIVVLDAATGKLVRTISIPGKAFASAASPDGRYLVIASPFGDGTSADKGGRTYVMDLRSDAVVASIPMDGFPSGIIVMPDSSKAFVSCLYGGDVAVIDLQGLRLERRIALAPGVDGMAYQN